LGVDQIRRAFTALDVDGKGELTVDEIKKHFGKSGEVFSQGEIEVCVIVCISASKKPSVNLLVLKRRR
jgi:Ca2+-binding EF-hand superfamily protein